MKDKTQSSGRRTIGVFTLAMINVAAIMSLKNLPMVAEYGVALIFFVTLSAIVFFIPTALVSAELATGWPKAGGVYVWVKEGLGEKWGFLSIWLQAIQDVVWLPTALTFAAATFAYAFNPALAKNKYYTLAVVLTVLWGITFLNLRGMKLSGLISSVGTSVGTVVPGIILIALGVVWVLKGNPSQVSFTAKSLIPNLGSANQLSILTGVVLALIGMEMSAVHAQDVKNPQRDYPKAIFLSLMLIVVLMIAGGLAIAIAVPQKSISLAAGVMEALDYFFSAFHMKWLIPILAVMASVGAVASISTWIAGPPRGVAVASRNGNLPPFCQKLNKDGMPKNLLIIQAAIATLMSLVILFMPSVGSSFWILSVLCTQVYLVMYLLMFIAAIRLRYSKPDVPRAYKIPFGNLGMWSVAGLGLLATVFVFFIGFFPPSQLKTGNPIFFVVFLAVGIIVLCGTPFVIRRFSKPSWLTQKVEGEVEEP